MIKFAAAVAGEIAHKVGIIADEPDLIESYDLTPADLDALQAHFGGAETRAVEIEPSALSANAWTAIAGELENAAEIAEANAEREVGGERRKLQAWRRELLAASKVAAAVEGA